MMAPDSALLSRKHIDEAFQEAETAQKPVSFERYQEILQEMKAFEARVNKLLENEALKESPYHLMWIECYLMLAEIWPKVWGEEARSCVFFHIFVGSSLSEEVMECYGKSEDLTGEKSIKQLLVAVSEELISWRKLLQTPLQETDIRLLTQVKVARVLGLKASKKSDRIEWSLSDQKAAQNDRTQEHRPAQR